MLLCMSQIARFHAPSHSPSTLASPQVIPPQVCVVAMVVKHIHCCSIVNDVLSSTAAPMDYGAVDAILMFDTCQRRSCVDVVIVNDAVLENMELFTVTLERTSGVDHTIELNPVDGQIEITDNDGVQNQTQ